MEAIHRLARLSPLEGEGVRLTETQEGAVGLAAAAEMLQPVLVQQGKATQELLQLRQSMVLGVVGQVL